MLSKVKVYVIIFTVVLIAYMIFIMYRYNTSKLRSEEHFTAPDSDYQARMYVMKVFDLVLNRKPTQEEIAKFSSYKNEQDILLHVLKTYSGTPTNAFSESEEERLHVTSEEESVTGRQTSQEFDAKVKVKVEVDAEEGSKLKSHAKPIPVYSPPSKSEARAFIQSAYVEAADMSTELYMNSDETEKNDTVCISRRVLKDLLDDLATKIALVRNLM